MAKKYVELVNDLLYGGMVSQEKALYDDYKLAVLADIAMSLRAIRGRLECPTVMSAALATIRAEKHLRPKAKKKPRRVARTTA